MSRAKNYRVPPFVMLPLQQLDSPAMMGALRESHEALTVYAHIRRGLRQIPKSERRGRPGIAFTNDGKVTLPFRFLDAVMCGATFRKALEALERWKFIETVAAGAWPNVAAIYRVSDGWRAFVPRCGLWRAFISDPRRAPRPTLPGCFKVASKPRGAAAESIRLKRETGCGRVRASEGLGPHGPAALRAAPEPPKLFGSPRGNGARAPRTGRYRIAPRNGAEATAARGRIGPYHGAEGAPPAPCPGTAQHHAMDQGISPPPPEVRP